MIAPQIMPQDTTQHHTIQRQGHDAGLFKNCINNVNVVRGGEWRREHEERERWLGEKEGRK